MKIARTVLLLLVAVATNSEYVHAHQLHTAYRPPRKPAPPQKVEVVETDEEFQSSMDSIHESEQQL